MKIYNILFILTAMLFIASCGNEFVVGDYYDLEELPGYVAFDADGNSAFIDPFDAEEGEVLNVIIENPTGTQSDITVDYALSGSAVYGEDYTIDGASASGGSMTISTEGQVFNETFRGNLPITIIDNDDYDEEPRTIIITLTGASNAEGDLAVGRGGTDFLIEATVNLIDNECDSQLDGTYNVATIADSLVIDGMLQEAMVDTFMSTASIVKDGGFFTYSIDDASGGLYASEFFGGSSLPLTFTEDCGAITIDGQTDFTGQNIILVNSSVGDDGTITLVLKGEDRGDQFTSIFTPQ
ncbi:hypothetical protein [Portibacter marinus]|uniref:hypothetical protein n=1 Tax=Portibacter marinus TaxID=2898660 RepID=UPI001F40F4C8|nr:hypothetical protein [Portibacter marinus]